MSAGASPPGDLNLAGRDAELARVASFLDDVEHGPRGLLLDGEPGIGKTALWSSAVASARARNYRVLESRSSEEEMPIAGVTLLDLFDSDDLGATDAVDGDVALSRGRVILGELGASAGEVPVVIAIDDLQWIDVVSGRALRYALRRIRSERVGLIATARSDPERYEVTATVDAFPPGKLEIIDLAPLDLDALRSVLDRIVSSISRPMLRRIHEISGGNPLYAIELARAIPAAGSRSRDVGLPTSLQEAISGNLERVPADLEPLLHVVAAQGRTSAQDLATLLEGSDVDALLATGVSNGLIIVGSGGDVRFAHPLLGTAVYARIPPLARRTLHRRLATITDDEDARARHLASSTDEPDEQVAQLLEDAARRAQARGAQALAAEFAGQSASVTAPADGADSHRRVLLQIDSLQAAGEASQARVIAARAMETWPRGPQRAELLVLRSFFESAGLDVALEDLRQALDEAGDDLPLRSRILERRASERSFEGDVAGALEDLRAAVAHLGGVEDQAIRARLKGALGLLELLSGTPRPDLMEDAVHLAGEQLETQAVDPRFDVARTSMWSGDLPAAREQVESLRALAAGADLVFPNIQALYDLSVLECASGDFAAAGAWAREGAQWARDYEDPWSESHFSYPFARVDVWTERVRDARIAIAKVREMAESYGARPDLIRAHWLLGLLTLRTVEIPEAVGHFTEAVRLLEETGIEHPAPYPVLPDAIEAFARSGDLAMAERSLSRLEEQANAVGSTWASAVTRRARGMFLLAGGDAEAALEPLSEAGATLDQLGFRPDAARAVLAHGSALLRLGHRVAAADAFSDARDRFAQMGAHPWAAKAIEELERVAPGRSEGELTTTEGRISALVAEGLKNREIAASLFVSPATVEAHLTRIYRKLGIGSRSELTRLVATRELDLPMHGASPDP